jgi:hypothetical protein
VDDEDREVVNYPPGLGVSDQVGALLRDCFALAGLRMVGVFPLGPKDVPGVDLLDIIGKAASRAGRSGHVLTLMALEGSGQVLAPVLVEAERAEPS